MFLLWLPSPPLHVPLPGRELLPGRRVSPPLRVQTPFFPHPPSLHRLVLCSCTGSSLRFACTAEEQVWHASGTLLCMLLPAISAHVELIDPPPRFSGMSGSGSPPRHLGCFKGLWPMEPLLEGGRGPAGLCPPPPPAIANTYFAFMTPPLQWTLTFAQLAVI